MGRKSIIALPILLTSLIAAPVFAAVTATPGPGDIVFNITEPDITNIINGGAGAVAIYPSGGEPIHGPWDTGMFIDWLPQEVTNISLTQNLWAGAGDLDGQKLPAGTYDVIVVPTGAGIDFLNSACTMGWTYSVCAAALASNDIPYYGFTSITVPEYTENSNSAPASIISIPTTFATTLGQNVSDQLQDPGTDLVVVVSMGITLSFFVILEIIAFLPEKKRRK